MKLSVLFFWLKPVKKVILEPFGWAILMIIVFTVPFLRVWWWIFAPLFLSIELRALYLWWIAWDYGYAKTKWVMLEILPPKQILVPLKAMEDVFAVMWGPLYNQANWRERWCEGALDNAPGWMSWEIVSIEGKLHFYLRITAEGRSSLETILYSHYPEMEINEVPDYTRNVPKNIPNEEWNVYGEDFILGNPVGYPIKTYEKFFEPQGERISAEEKRIDPMASLLEAMSRLGANEQFWLQVITMSVSDTDEPQFRKSAESIIAKLAKRPEKKTKTIWDEIASVLYDLVIGPKKEGSGEKATYKWIESKVSEEGEREMVLTPGEREIITEVENKLKKPVFRTVIRGVYVAKRENWNPVNRILTRSYFSHFQTQNLNYIRFSTLTRPKTHYVFRERIPFIRTRRMFRNYILRFPSFFPDRRKECPILNTEELATIFHFPIKISGVVFPTMSRVQSKKGGPPPNLPTE
ncbi:MAG: hypothetical protein A3A98_03125 [Candidatus Staskawiczbacteria bacterium RIFCSPLOWO2_01_FULL_40_39]|uniref:Uncharacterized protein n=1 Tax=Candidatus Staskawiczbacteria bacterium RIFCSPHIGHO2_01_FULL_39_25 TaxID=1802202 RepID=A0A1G2HNG0_9BACT|nr:MAG: hypothetical protein A2730_01425 [Candidatus Staskawiczbacteria bacterium RIFCSPHIGHO2_01_FULL_39_25]OGZ73015.1 MAG: hypothetical protein A3A98_03125 [Candidatus Staskawiczbacteria bacterium RIFCSPLOWO2_01_FULL_40_39]